MQTQMLQGEVNVDRTWVLLFGSEASPAARGLALSLESAGAEGRSQSGTCSPGQRDSGLGSHLVAMEMELSG